MDGGVTPANAYQLIEAGANALVAGSAVFGAKSYSEGESKAQTPFVIELAFIIHRPFDSSRNNGASQHGFFKKEQLIFCLPPSPA